MRVAMHVIDYVVVTTCPCHTTIMCLPCDVTLEIDPLSACRFHPSTECRERSRFGQDDRPLLVRDVALHITLRKKDPQVSPRFRGKLLKNERPPETRLPDHPGHETFHLVLVRLYALMPQSQPERRDGYPRFLVERDPPINNRSVNPRPDPPTHKPGIPDSHAPHQSSQTDLPPAFQCHPNAHIHPHPLNLGAIETRLRNLPALQFLQRAVVRLDVAHADGRDELAVKVFNLGVLREQTGRGEES